MNTLTLDYARGLYVFKHESGGQEELPLSRVAENVASSMATKGWKVVRVYSPVEGDGALLGTQDEPVVADFERDSVSSQEVAQMLGVTITRVHQLAKQGILTTTPDSSRKKKWFKRADIQQILSARDEGLNTKQVAQMLGVGVRRVHQFVEDKLLTPMSDNTYGAGLLFKREEVDRLLTMRGTKKQRRTRDKIGLRTLTPAALTTLGGLANALVDIAARAGVDVATLTATELCKVIAKVAADRDIDVAVTVNVATEGQRVTWSARRTGG